MTIPPPPFPAVGEKSDKGGLIYLAKVDGVWQETSNLHDSDPASEHTDTSSGLTLTNEECMTLHVLLNEYEFSDEETVSIFHDRTGLTQYFCAHIAQDYYQHEAKWNSHWREIDRPNPYNTMYYTDEELDNFDNKRTEIENCAAKLNLAAGGVGYDIIHQTGISFFGVQVNLMHRQGTPSGPPLVTTPAIASSAVPPSQAVQSDSTSPPEPSYPTLRMVHRCVLEKARTERIDGFMARSVAFCKSFKDDADNAFDRETYKRGGQTMRVHFEEYGAQASYSADVMVCDASTCYSDCAILPGVQLLPPLATGGQPFVHSIRDCFKPSNGELEFQPLETDNYAFFDKVPELEHGVPVCFDIDASGSKVQVLTTVCRWDKCETCKLFLCDDDIARLEENKENDGITEEKGNALARPRSKREDQEYQHDIDQGETWGYANETGWDNGSGWNNGSGWADGSAWGNGSAWDYGSVIEPPFDYTALVKRFARSTSTDGLEGLIEHVSSMDPDLAEATLRSLNMQPSEEDDRLEDGGLEDCLSCDVKKGKEK